MALDSTRDVLIKRLGGPAPFRFVNEAEYFFLLGQALVGVFAILGGTDKYRREFSYLSNPSVHLGSGAIGKRVSNFLGKIRGRVCLPETLEVVVNALVDPVNLARLERIADPVGCEQAFYEGLYNESIFTQL